MDKASVYPGPLSSLYAILTKAILIAVIEEENHFIGLYTTIELHNIYKRHKEMIIDKINCIIFMTSPF